jgi:hypothetical protein
VSALEAQARIRLETGDVGRALDGAHRAATLFEILLSGLAEEQGALARGRYAAVFEVGAAAALRSQDLRAAVYFLESGRAGSLLEALGGRQAMRWAGVPEELQQAQLRARGAEAAALAAYSRALDGDDRAATRRAWRALDASREGVREVVARIQREAKREAGLWYPRVAPLEEIQSWLGAEDALLVFGPAMGEVVAVVVTRSDARMVALGDEAVLAEACERIPWQDPRRDTAPEVAALRRLVVEPLGLAPESRRLLISPEGPLSYVPFAALVPDRTVAYECSGTTLGLLLEGRGPSGKGILALGDPVYGAAGGSRVHGSGRELVPLPGSRAEAALVGDVVLLGKDASEAGLRAARPEAGSRRWHAVHLACHGLIDVERPTLSSLALAPDAENDGLLTALDVLDLDLPTDLAVLSACETGRGKIMRGEGIVGLTRAFMFAGAPRVICSLWNVDDEATLALMARFYELWNPKDDKAGLPAAEALRRAQEHVRSQERWKHPYYWAAWVLWGLPS